MERNSFACAGAKLCSEYTREGFKGGDQGLEKFLLEDVCVIVSRFHTDVISLLIAENQSRAYFCMRRCTAVL